MAPTCKHLLDKLFTAYTTQENKWHPTSCLDSLAPVLSQMTSQFSSAQFTQSNPRGPTLHCSWTGTQDFQGGAGGDPPSF